MSEGLVSIEEIAQSTPEDISKIDAIDEETAKELIERAKERDHRKIGKELELFTFSSRVGNGLPLWLPNGTELRDLLQNFLEEVVNFLQLFCATQ